MHLDATMQQMHSPRMAILCISICVCVVCSLAPHPIPSLPPRPSPPNPTPTPPLPRSPLPSHATDSAPPPQAKALSNATACSTCDTTLTYLDATCYIHTSISNNRRPPPHTHTSCTDQWCQTAEVTAPAENPFANFGPYNPQALPLHTLWRERQATPTM